MLSWDLGPLTPGQKKDLAIALPQGEQSEQELGALDAEAGRRRAIAYWNQLDLPYDRITVPDPAMQTLPLNCQRI